MRYVLEGSIRREGDRVRISAQLIDAANGAHRWAERYDRKLEDILTLQIELACTIVTVLAAHVNKAEVERALMKSPTAWQAHDCCLMAKGMLTSYQSLFCAKELYEARRLLQKALTIDPSYAQAHAALAMSLCVLLGLPI